MLTFSLDGAVGFYQLMLTPGFTTYADEAYFTFNNYVLLWAPFYIISGVVPQRVKRKGSKAVLAAFLLIIFITSSAAPRINAQETTIRDVPDQPYDVTETGVIGQYSFSEGEYTRQVGPMGSGIFEYVNRPETILSFT